MVERTAKGKQARQYFIECEKRLSGSLSIPQTLPEALRLAADLADMNRQQAARLALAEPKAAALERISAAAGEMCLTDAAKTLGMPPKAFMAWLHEHRWIYKHGGQGSWIAYQPRINAGQLRHREHVYTDRSGQERAVSQVVVTAKGVARLAELLNTGGTRIRSRTTHSSRRRAGTAADRAVHRNRP